MRFVKEPLKRALATMGLEIKPSSPLLTAEDLSRRHLNRPTHVIEFLGPSSAGKTHVMKDLLPRLGESWVHSVDLHPGLWRDPLMEADPRLIAFFRHLLGEKCRRFADAEFEHKHFATQLRALEFYLESIRRNCYLSNGCPVDIINDEGLVSNFAEELLTFQKEDHPLVTHAFRRRVVVFLKISEERFLKNVALKRQARAKHAPHYFGFSEADLKDHYQKTYLALTDLVRFLSSVDVQVVTVTPEQDSLAGVHDKISDALQRLS